MGVFGGTIAEAAMILFLVRFVSHLQRRSATLFEVAFVIGFTYQIRWLLW
jgi:hypothetical protein